jgi:uncharacterized protein YpmB
MRKLNGETITGIDILILVIGVAFMVLGVWTLRKEQDHARTESEHRV